MSVLRRFAGFTAVAALLFLLAALAGCPRQSPPSGSPQASAPESPPTLLPVFAEKTAKKRAKGLKPFDKPKESLLFFLSQRLPRGETALDFGRYETAMTKAAGLDLYATRTGQLIPAKNRTTFKNSRRSLLSGWTSLGPGNIGGRTRSLLVHPTTPAIMYAGGVAGGVFKTETAGASWEPMTDLALANLAVNAMAMTPGQPNVIYAGTGEGFFSVDAMRGAGIFKTPDGGKSWTHLADTSTSDFYYVNKIVVSPNSASRVYAATRTGIFVSPDGGTHWDKTYDATAKNGCLDLVVRTDRTPDVIFASCGMDSDAQGNPIQADIIRSTAAGTVGTWKTVHTEANMSRTSLALAPSKQDTIYALASSSEAGTFKSGLLAVLRSIDGGDVWTARVRNTSPTKLNRLLLTNPATAYANQCEKKADEYFNQGWYDNVIAVDPVNPDIVWAGGIDLFRSDNAGADWGLGSYWWPGTTYASYNHADHHAIIFHPGYNGTTNRTMFVGNDGGVFRTVDARAAVSSDPCAPLSTPIVWASLNNGLGITQFYYGAVYPSGDVYFGGTQDNGTVRGSDMNGANLWATIMGGDGGAVAVNPRDTNVLYGEYTELSVNKSTDGGKSFTQHTTGITDPTINFPFIAPFVMDPGDPERLWLGGTKLWRTDNGAAIWTQASPAVPAKNMVSALSVSPLDSDRVAAGTSVGYVLTTTAGRSATSTTPWQTVLVAADGYISSVTHDPRQPSTLFATCSTFGLGHVFKSTNGGAAWTCIDGAGSTALPDIPTHSILIDPANSSRLYVGTDIGVFVSLNGGATWAVENTGFANALSQRLVYNTTSREAYVFTHGRGVWRVPLANPDISGAAGLLLFEE